MDDSNPHKLIPISFTLRSQVDIHFYQINSRTDQPKTDKYLVQTRSQTKSRGIKILEIHGANKSLDPHVKPPQGALAFSFIYCGIVQKSNLANIFSIVFKNHYHYYLYITLTKDCLHILFPSLGLVKVELY